MQYKRLLVAVPLATLIVAGVAVGVASAAGPASSGFHGFGGRPFTKPAAVGTVTAINGTAITISDKDRSGIATTYMVDASNATVTKNGSPSSLSSVAVGDTVMVQGTVNGTSITATAIFDGAGRGDGQWRGPRGGSAAPMIQGNGEPVVGGTVTAVNGTTLTVTNKSNVSYTIDASSAIIEKGGVSSTMSSITTGDNVLVQGAVNGNAVTASSVIDEGSGANAQPNASSSTGMPMAHRGGIGGFFGAIGGFFQHLFGFF